MTTPQFPTTNSSDDKKLAMRTKLAELICNSDALLCPKKWLDEEASDLATRIPHLDEIPSQALILLAKIVVSSELDSRKLSIALDIDDKKLEEYLDALCNIDFIEWTGSSYKATISGEKAFNAIGQRMVAREIFQLKARLKQLGNIIEFKNI